MGDGRLIFIEKNIKSQGEINMLWDFLFTFAAQNKSKQ